MPVTMRTGLPSGRPVRFESMNPLVACLPANAEVMAKIREAVLAAQIGNHELQPFRHLIRPCPGHRATFLRSRIVPAGCYPLAGLFRNPCPSLHPLTGSTPPNDRCTAAWGTSAKLTSTLFGAAMGYARLMALKRRDHV